MELHKSKKAENITAIVLFVGLLVSIIPLLIASFYSRPVSDDFIFSAGVHRAIESGGGLSEVLSAGFRQVKETYFDWQGTYSAVFIFAFQPAVFSDRLYFLTTFVMLGFLIFSTVFFFNTVFGCLGINKKYGLIISCMILFLSIHFIVDKHQGFYWWNGSSYYTLFYSFSLILYSVLIKVYFSDNRSRRIIYFVSSLLLSAIIGGGNYTTALLTAIILALAACAAFQFRRKIMPYYIVTFFVFMLCFTISIIAPGNKVRAAYFPETSPIAAVFLSIAQAVKFIGRWTGLSQMICFVVIGVMALSITRKSEYSFKYPLFVFVVSVLVFASQLTPPIYAMHFVGAGRQVNIYYYSYYLLVTFNIFYFSGWINRNKLIKIKTEKIKPSYPVCAMILCIGIFVSGCLGYSIYSLTFVDTSYALIQGTPETYVEQYEKILNELKNGNYSVCDVSTVPDFLCAFEFENGSYGNKKRNIVVYYGFEDKLKIANQY